MLTIDPEEADEDDAAGAAGGGAVDRQQQQRLQQKQQQRLQQLLQHRPPVQHGGRTPGRLHGSTPVVMLDPSSMDEGGEVSCTNDLTLCLSAVTPHLCVVTLLLYAVSLHHSTLV